MCSQPNLFFCVAPHRPKMVLLTARDAVRQAGALGSYFSAGGLR